MKLELYFSPGSCPRVSMIALEETGAPFETHLIAFMAGEHRKPEFLARNPSGKVPVLLVDGQPIVQTVAILGFLDESFPDAALFPKRDSPLAGAVPRRSGVLQCRPAPHRHPHRLSTDHDRTRRGRSRSAHKSARDDGLPAEPLRGAAATAALAGGSAVVSARRLWVAAAGGWRFPRR
jgi:Glutathione S-transferase, N-terminal domain